MNINKDWEFIRGRAEVNSLLKIREKHKTLVGGCFFVLDIS